MRIMILALIKYNTYNANIIHSCYLVTFQVVLNHFMKNNVLDFNNH